jgi:hypothetical protein
MNLLSMIMQFVESMELLATVNIEAPEFGSFVHPHMAAEVFRAAESPGAAFVALEAFLVGRFRGVSSCRGSRVQTRQENWSGSPMLRSLGGTLTAHLHGGVSVQIPKPGLILDCCQLHR